MYQIITTSGFIIDSKPNGDAGKTFSIFTREIGLIRASAQGIRLEKSKLRYHSQEYTLGDFSFVRGKDIWRMTNAGIVQENKQIDKNRISLVARLALLLRRLLHGEEVNVDLFEHIERSLIFIYNSPILSEEQLKILESIIVYKMLNILGYIGSDKALEKIITNNDLSISVLDDLSKHRLSLNQHINKALKESHL